MAYVISNTIRKVKNLGWLLRNWRKVEYAQFHYAPDHTKMIDGLLEVYCRNGDKYFSDFACFSVFLDWINRPVFKGIPLVISANGKNFGALIVGSPEFVAFRNLRNYSGLSR